MTRKTTKLQSSKVPKVQISENEYQGLLTQSVLLRTILSQLGGFYEVLQSRMNQVALNNVIMEPCNDRQTIRLRLEPEDFEDS